MQRLLLVLFCVVLSSVNWAYSRPNVETVYVVDRLSGSSSNEFVDLESATRALCSRQGAQSALGRVVINRNAPLIAVDLDLNCDLVLEAADAGRAVMTSLKDFTLTSRGKLVLQGMSFSGEGQFHIRALGPLEIKKTAILMPATLTAASTFRFDGNEVSDFTVELTSQESDAAIVISANRGGKFKVKTEQGPDRVLEVYENTFASFSSNFCGRSLSVNLNNNVLANAALRFQSNLVKTRIFGGRIVFLSAGPALCSEQTEESQTADITFMQTIVDRFEASRDSGSILGLSLNTDATSQIGAFKVNWGEGQSYSRVSLLARGTRFSGDFSWVSAGEVTLDLENAEIESNANITNSGSVTAKFNGVHWRRGVTINTLSRSEDTRPSLDVTQFGGSSGSHFEIATNGNGYIYANVTALKLGTGARLFLGRRTQSKPESSVRNELSRVVVRDIEFTKAGQYLQVAGLDGDIAIEANRFNLDIAEFGYAGLRLADHSKGRIEVLRNEFLVATPCDLQCSGVRAQNTSGLTLKENKFFVYGKNGHAVEAHGSAVAILNNEFTGGQGHGSLIEATNLLGMPARSAILLVRANKLNATELVSVQLTGPLLASFTENTFSGSGLFNDGPGSDFAVEGGLVEDPILNNTGLHDKSVTTSIDFDGNGCRDIPRDANRRDASGLCIATGKIRPTLPK